MMINNKEKRYPTIKYNISSFLYENKFFIIFLILVLVIGLLTGIFTGIKYCNGADVYFNDFSVCNFIEGKLGSLSLFFSRMLSYEIVLLILFLSSFNVYLIPINLLIIAYRSYLLGLNLTVIILCYGLGGIFTAILIIFPCQLAILFFMILYSSSSAQRCICIKRYGKVYKDNILTNLLLFTIIITTINIIETILLSILSSRIILVL